MNSTEPHADNGFALIDFPDASDAPYHGEPIPPRPNGPATITRRTEIPLGTTFTQYLQEIARK